MDYEKLTSWLFIAMFILVIGYAAFAFLVHFRVRLSLGVCRPACATSWCGKPKKGAPPFFLVASVIASISACIEGGSYP